MSIDSKSPYEVGPGHGKGGMLLQVEEVYNDVKDRFGPTHFMGSYNNRNVGTTSSKSMHAYGRAFDIGGSKAVMQLIANYCRKISGVQYVIYNKQISGPGANKPWREYVVPKGGSPHYDHVHVDFMGSFKGYKPGAAEKPPTVKKGDTDKEKGGGFIALLQEWLGLITDGFFGPKTKEAVEEFQDNRDLEKDGIVGKNTWKTLSSEKGIFFYK